MLLCHQKRLINFQSFKTALSEGGGVEGKEKRERESIFAILSMFSLRENKKCGIHKLHFLN